MSKGISKSTALFAEEVRTLVRRLPKTLSNFEDLKQLVRASGSVAANCIEGNEALGTRDRVLKFRTCRKEAKECGLWLRLADPGEDPAHDERRRALRQEALELKLIFSTIVMKLE